MNGRVQRRTGNAHPSMSPHGVYACAGDDRWLAISCENDAQWQQLCALTGRDELISDDRFADVVARVRNRSELDQIITTWTQTRDVHAAALELQAAGVPAGAAQLVSELLEDEQLKSRAYATIVSHPEAGETPYARPAFALSRTGTYAQRHAPLYGQDIDYVLGDVLGMSDSDVQALEDAHVTARRPL